MPLTPNKKLELLYIRVSALEKALEELTGAYSGLMLNCVGQETTDPEIISEADKIKPKRTNQ